MPGSSAFEKRTHVVRALSKFMHLQARLEANKPTFSKFLGVTYEHGKEASSVREDQTFFVETDEIRSKPSLVFRYRFPPDQRLRYLDEERDDPSGDRRRLPRRETPSLSAYTSILDEVTTLGLVTTNTKKPFPGVSVTMQTQWGPGGGAHANPSSNGPPPQEVDIVATVTKLGRTLGFVRAEVRDPSNNNALVCYFDHVKYLPPGWVLGLLLSPVGLWCLDLVLKLVQPFRKSNKIADETEDSAPGIMDPYIKTSETTAAFRVGPEHCNGMGGLHGGVQAVLMERLGRSVAYRELLNVDLALQDPSSSIYDVECQQLQISYQSSASKVLELRAHVIDPPRPGRHSATLRIEILRSSSGNAATKASKAKRVVIVSEGVLTFASVSSKAKDQ